MTEIEQVVDRFISTWAAGDVEGMLACLAEDVRAQNMPMEATVGVDAIRELQAAFFAVATNFRIDVHRQVVDGNAQSLRFGLRHPSGEIAQAH